MQSGFRSVWRAISLRSKYEPQPVRFRTIWYWLRQFPRNLRWEVFGLLHHISFISAEETEKHLIEQNEMLSQRLLAASINPDQIIYVSFDAAGSSSGVMLNSLRDRANLVRKGSRLVHSNDGKKMTKFSNEIGRGAIVYVDDFSGSGRQFKRNRNAIFPFIVGNFSEFFLAACMCEEALEVLEELGVAAMPGVVHYKKDRPLHSESNLLDSEARARMIQLCREIHPQKGLGFRKLATMVVLDHNAPNTTPLLFRGSLHQAPVKGIFPRWDDLPI